MGRIIHVARKEFIQAFRDPRMFAIIFIAPIFQLFLFGYAVTTDVRNITIAVMDRDKSLASRDLVRAVLNSGYFTFVGEVETEEEITEALVNTRADVVLVFPERFADRLDRGEAAPLQVLMDGAESNSSGVAMGYLQKILVTYGRGQIDTRMDRLSGLTGSGKRPEPWVNPEIRYQYNPELKSSWYMVPGVLCMILMVVTMILTSLAITREREIGTMEQLVVTPIKPWQLVAGKMIPFAIIGMVDVTLILVVAAGHFGLPMVGSIGLLYFATSIFLFTTLGMGLLISTLSHTQQQAIFLALMVHDDLCPPVRPDVPDRQHARTGPMAHLCESAAILPGHRARRDPQGERPVHSGAPVLHAVFARGDRLFTGRGSFQQDH